MDTLITIDDSTPTDVTHPGSFGRGLVPRDFDVDPPDMFAAPTDMPLIPRSEWDDRIAEQEKEQSSLEHIRLRAGIPSLNQGQVGYCWAHSITHTVMLARAAANQPYVPLSAYAVAATIKKGRDEGGWCGLSAKFAREKGIPSQAIWPQGDRNYTQHDNAATWADAAKHEITEDWVDLTRDVWGQNLTFDQVATCLLLNIPCALDFNWWSHSVCGLRLVKSGGGYGIKIWNSWGDSWSDRGMGILSGTKAIPNGAVATRVTTAS